MQLNTQATNRSRGRSANLNIDEGQGTDSSSLPDESENGEASVENGGDY